uniref:Thioredoxin-fold protein n=1 Tax=Pithovirus LCPAC403 TaxID=2506596 RepID=A0A481ZEJ1_9VIRU|nr:MAG: thioredoxin-fold protein [Pithovirus LCPAC403]
MNTRRADLVIVTAQSCGACEMIDSEKHKIIGEYSKRDDIKLIFIHEQKESVVKEVGRIYPSIANLTSWTPFVILISPVLINGNLKYEIMNNGSFNHANSREGINKFVDEQLKTNPIFSSRQPKQDHTTVASLKKKENRYSLERQNRSKSNSPYSRDRNN